MAAEVEVTFEVGSAVLRRESENIIGIERGVIRFAKPPHPAGLFNSEEDARAWALDHVREGH